MPSERVEDPDPIRELTDLLKRLVAPAVERARRRIVIADDWLWRP